SPYHESGRAVRPQSDHRADHAVWSDIHRRQPRAQISSDGRLNGSVPHRAGGCERCCTPQMTARDHKEASVEPFAILDGMKLAFIGLGQMGSGMAHNLLRAGYELTVFNRSREKAASFENSGVRIASSPAEACRDAEVVLTMLADDTAVEQVVFG